MEYSSSLDKVNYIMMHKNKHTLDIFEYERFISSLLQPSYYLLF